MSMLNLRVPGAVGLPEYARDQADLTRTPPSLAERSAAAAAVAARFAASVDEQARFPEEAVAAIRAQGLLSIQVPRHLGGEGAGISDVLDVCYTLGRACASTAMIYAMHQTKVACIVRHGRDSTWHKRLLRRLSAEQLLLASSTTEGGNGGNVRSSTAPIIRSGSRISLDRAATVISYGAQADGVVTTARRSADAPPSDQVLVVFLKEDYALEPTLSWDTLGMRGTCSRGFALRAVGAGGQILPDGYDKIHAQTMTPVAHLLWSAAWTGIATDAVERARSFVRKAARQSGGQLPPGASQFVKADTSLRMLRGVLATALRAYERAVDDPRALAAMEFQTAINLLKVDASELAVATVMAAMRACGLSGYRNDGEFSLGRHLRDVLSSPIMINNERIVANVSPTALLGAAPTSLNH